jgi:hypothetical protein
LLNSLLGTLSSGVAASTSSYESIATVVGTGSATSLSFNSISADYKHLQIRGIGRTVNSAGSLRDVLIRFNSDTGSNYVFHTLQGDGSSATSNGNTAQTSIIWDNVPDAGFTANCMNGFILDIHDYASTTKNKTTRAFYGFDSNLGTTANRLSLRSGLWLSTSAITSITVSCTVAFATSFQLALYGIKGA